jgi:hypothetical protein
VTYILAAFVKLLKLAVNVVMTKEAIRVCFINCLNCLLTKNEKIPKHYISSFDNLYDIINTISHIIAFSTSRK